MKKENGITLVALVITIIVLLILATVSVQVLTGDNGLLIKSRSAVDKYSEGETKERIMLAVTNAKMKNMGLLDRTTLDNELKSEFGEGNYELLPVGEGFLISVNNIEYLVEKDGKVSDGNKVEESNIEYAGDLSKGGQYNGTTEDTAYRITCIEDLVTWTNNSNTYKNKYIKLEKTLDFNSTASYNNARAKTTDINGNETAEALITELTTGTGFKPIQIFSGTFDGQNNEIKNIYENKIGDAGLIIETERNVSVTIKNLGITGNINGNSHVGGIIAWPAGQYSKIDIINCYNLCKIQARAFAGGIVGYSSGSYQSNIKIINCYNEGEINGNYAGGIIGGGHAYNFIVYNVYNNGNVNGTCCAGGILGGENDTTCTLTVYNSFNNKKIKAENSGGIGGKVNIYPYNVYNIGEIVSLSNIKPAGIVGWAYNIGDLNTSYYLNNTTVARAGANQSWKSNQVGLGGYTKEQMQSYDFINTLNNYVDTYNEEHKNDEGFISLKRWKYTEGNYPTFE